MRSMTTTPKHKGRTGRPGKTASGPMETIAVRLPVAQIAWLDDALEARQVANPGLSRADLVREIIHEAIVAKVVAGGAVS